MKIRGLIATTLAMAVFFCMTGCNQNNSADKENQGSGNSSAISDTASNNTSIKKTMLLDGGKTYELYNTSHHIRKTEDTTVIEFTGYEADDYDSDMTTMAIEINGELRDLAYKKVYHDQRPDANFMLTVYNVVGGAVFTESNAEHNDFYSCYLLVGEPDEDGNVEISLDATVLEGDKQSYFLNCSGTFPMTDTDT